MSNRDNGYSMVAGISFRNTTVTWLCGTRIYYNTENELTQQINEMAAQDGITDIKIKFRNKLNPVDLMDAQAHVTAATI